MRIEQATGLSRTPTGQEFPRVVSWALTTWVLAAAVEEEGRTPVPVAVVAAVGHPTLVLGVVNPKG